MRRYTYVIGDLQGCFSALKALLKQIQFDPSQDFIYFAGDLVARGEDSLSCLRFVKKLVENGSAQTVLGNHDLTLIACARGFKKIKDKDKTKDLIDAIDSDDLIDWLRKQPLCLFPNEKTILTHAGVPCIWTAEQTAQYAKEVEYYLAHDDFEVLDCFLQNMYGSEPDIWSDDLTGFDRIRTITNYLTRMRLTDKHGRLEFSFKESLDDPMPKGFKPWFEFEGLTEKTHQILFGHWAALKGQNIAENAISLDAGCVWGGQLMAYCLETEQKISVNNPALECEF